MPKKPKSVTASFVESPSSSISKVQRPTVVKATLSFEGVVTEGCEDAVMAFLGDHLRRYPLQVKDAEGNVISLSYKGGAKFRVEFDRLGISSSV